MKIGIFSDLHDNLRHLEVVKAELLEAKIETLIFCGDFDMPFSMRGFIGFNVPIKAVLGNGDPDIQKYLYQLQNLDVLRSLDIQINDRFHDLIIDNCRIGVNHGDDDSLIKSLTESQLYDLLCIGHTHIPSVTKTGKTVIVNPGSLVGWKYEVKGHKVPVTYSIYDTRTNIAAIYEANM